jgi:8-oxo-dGTP pyrophosphatase MutT (NUDIX family)
MELNSEVVTTPPRPAATVVILRDTADDDAGLEVLLLKRHGLSEVLGGAFVFPGGKVDLADTQLDAASHLDQSLQSLHSGLGEPDIEPLTAASLYVAAIREAFEESGVLFAQGATVEHATQAAALLKEGLTFGAMLSHMGLRLQSAQLLPWSRWITPQVPSVTNKRFDTRFFVATLPATQIARHDNHETTESVWLTPRKALALYWESKIELAPPQIMSLVSLERHRSVAGVMQAARQRLPPVIAPEPFDHEGSRIICYPGDERHSVRTQHLPGPTRLIYRNKRFEPIAGFESLFVD